MIKKTKTTQNNVKKISKKRAALSCPYFSGHISNLAASLRYSRGDFIFRAL